MRDIPMFTTSNGVASLLLKKIPFTKEAFVHIRDSLSCDELIKECIDVCRMAGAEHIFVTGHEDLKKHAVYCNVNRYCINKDQLPFTDAVALPLSQQLSDWWRQVYNEKMAGVAAAAPLSKADVDGLIRAGNAYCVYRDCLALGIGVCDNGEIQAVASLIPGCGKDVVSALGATIEQQQISLCVASTNEKAIRLYQSMGFVNQELESTWYKIFSC